MIENTWRATRSRRPVRVGHRVYVLCHLYKSSNSDELCDFRRHSTVDGLPVCQRHLYRIVHKGDPYATPVSYEDSREPRYDENGTLLNPQGGPQVETLALVFAEETEPHPAVLDEPEQMQAWVTGTPQTVPSPVTTVTTDPAAVKPRHYTDEDHQAWVDRADEPEPPEEDTSYYVGAPEPEVHP